VSGPASLTADGLAAGARGSSQRAHRDVHALALALLVVAVGALVGAGGFAAERRLSSWLPEATRTASGWRVADRHGRPFDGLSLEDGHVAWHDGPFVLLMDLDDGRIRLLGPGLDNSATWRPDLSGRFVAWFEAASGASDRGGVYAYDLGSRRRLMLTTMLRPLSHVSASDGRAVWIEEDPSASPSTGYRLVVVDLDTGARSTVSSPLGEPRLEGDTVLLGTSDGLFTVDLTTGLSRPVAAPAGRGRVTTGFDLSGERVAWGWRDAAGHGRVLVCGIGGGGSEAVAGADGLIGPAIDGGLVVWAARSGGVSSIVGRRLGGGEPFAIATVAAPLRHLDVDDGTVAWLYEGTDGRSVIETAEVRE
jgi:hypothetical protein